MMIAMPVLAAERLADNGIGQTIKEIYELQEHCGKRAEEYLMREHGGRFAEVDEHLYYTVTIANHYNKKLNKCFIKQEMTNHFSGKDVFESIIVDVLDVNENVRYAWFAAKRGEGPKEDKDCDVEGRVCHTRAEWEMLIAPFMED